MQQSCVESNNFHVTKAKTLAEETEDLELKNKLQCALWQRMAERQIYAHKDPIDEHQWIRQYSEPFNLFYKTNRSFFGEWAESDRHEMRNKKLMTLEFHLYYKT